jgi:Family of unknown function (DUF6491)
MRGLKMRLLRLSIVAAALFSTTTPSPAAEEPAKPSTPCVFVSQIDHFQYVDDKSAILETSPNKRFKVTFFSACRELRWAIFARVEARPGICLAKGDKIVVGRTHGIEERCVIDSIEAMPPRIPKSAETEPNAR